MTLLDSLQDILGQGASRQDDSRRDGQGGSGQGSLQNVLGQLFGDPKTGAGIPVLGGIIGALTSKSTIRGAAGGALLMKGIQMYSQYRDRMKQEAARNAGNPVARNYMDAQAAPSAPDERAERIIRAVVYAAKSDGHVDAAEHEAIMARMRSLNLGEEGERLVRRAMEEPVDPAKIAEGVKTPEEALEVFTVSCAVLGAGGFMVNAYLSELAKDLAIPEDVRDSLVAEIGKAAIPDNSSAIARSM